MSRLGQHDVGHEGVITGCDALSLRSPIADPRGVAQPPLQSTYSHNIPFNKCSPQFKKEVNGYFNNEYAFFIHVAIKNVFLEKEFNGLM
ncbi:hypothetical protein [Lysinibacillus sp. NPDC092081]|uniref:hypothetical protein n=1 Tax=Lysinibacillus sp. NPDC092081 TaxID=3364131 RepID=UPI0037F2EA6E